MSRYQGMNLEATISEVCAYTDITTHAVQLCRTYSIIVRARVAADSSLLCSELPPSSDQDCRRVRPPAVSRRVPRPKEQRTTGYWISIIRQWQWSSRRSRLADMHLRGACEDCDASTVNRPRLIRVLGRENIQESAPVVIKRGLWKRCEVVDSVAVRGENCSAFSRCIASWQRAEY